jgi:predicted Zn-dependent protease
MRLLLLLILASPLHAENQRAKLSQFAKGVYAEQNQDHQGARKLYEASLADAPHTYYLARKTSTSQLATNDLPAASGTLRHYAQEHPDHLDSHIDYADFLNQYTPRDATARNTAIETLERANKNFPHTSAVFSPLINLYENNEEPDKSRALLRAQFDAPEAGPFHWMSLAPIVRTLLPSDSPELPERLETIALKTAETGIEFPSAVRSVSDYYRKTGRLAEAIVVLQKHVEAVPNSLELRTRLGLLLIYADRTEEAEASLLETLSIDHDQVLAHKALAKLYADAGDIDKSLHHRSEVLKIAGGDPQDFLELANEYLKNEQPHPARLILDNARFDHPKHVGIATRLAIATLRDGDTEIATLQFRLAEALAKDSKDPDDKKFLGANFQLEFAGALRDAGDLPAAESRLREAVRNTPPEKPKQAARALRELAKLWLDQDKNHSPATSLLKRAASLDPDNEETAALLERARKK